MPGPVSRGGRGGAGRHISCVRARFPMMVCGHMTTRIILLYAGLLVGWQALRSTAHRKNTAVLAAPVVAAAESARQNRCGVSLPSCDAKLCAPS